MADLQIFISYKSERRAIALKVRDVIQSWGYQTWFDQDDIAKGKKFYDEIDAGLKSSKVIIGILTLDALSDEVKEEWRYAITHKVQFILLRYEVILEPPYWLENIQYIDCMVDEKQGFNLLRKTLSAPTYIQQSSSETSSSYLPPSSPNDIRQTMLDNVHQSWIKGALEPNLKSGLMDTGLTLKPDAVLRQVDYRDYELPDSAGDIEAIFHDMNGELLILGEPGGGKTILLLQLADKLLGRAQTDGTQPIPAIFNLSSWGKDRKLFADWLTDELVRSYAIPRKTAKRWIGDGKLTLLLDGLDEIAPSDDFLPGSTDQANLDERAIELRSACIAAINVYRDAHPQVAMAVCSRIGDYEPLSEKFNLNAAIVLYPLTDVQISDYLAGDDYSGVRELIVAEPAVAEMAHKPFLLSMMKVAYRQRPYVGNPHKRLKLDTSDPHQREKHMLAEYVEQLLKESPHEKYSHAETRNYIKWLAWQMQRHKTSLFYIEELQPDWLNHTKWYSFLTSLIAGTLVFSSLFFALSSIFSPMIGLLIGIVGGIWSGLNSGGIGKIVYIERRMWSILRFSLIMCLVVGLIGIWFNVIVGAIALGLALGAWAIDQRMSQENLDLRTTPNAGYQESLVNVLIVGLIFGVGFAITISLLELQSFLPSFWLIFGLWLGLPFGGGIVVIQHLVLRLVANSEKNVPRWRYDTFLDYCAKMGLLRKVGGGYIFRHRILLEYFAAQYQDKQAK